MRSLLWRLTLTHLLVSLLAVALLAVSSPLLFRHYYLKLEQARLQSAAQGLAVAAGRLLPLGDSTNLQVLIRTSAEVIGGEVAIADRDGQLVIASGSASGNSPAEGRLEVTVPLAGGAHTLRVARVVPGLSGILRTQRLVTGLAALLAVVAAALLALASARAISAPLVTMSETARQFAAQDFSARVAEAGPHEIRSLAASLNRMAHDLQEAFDELRATDRLRREFVASASHELRAPLTSIRGFLEALQDGTADTLEQQRRCLQAAAAEAARMTRLVEDLLQLSRLQAHVLQFEFAPTDLGELISGVAEGFQPRLAEKRVQLSLELASVPRLTVDGERLAQVIINLLDNALRHSPEGGTITVRLRPSAAGAAVSVLDEGPGIAEADLPVIWERFHKGDPARPRSDQGAGLGLAIAREIVLAHGGEVFARNRAEGGAEVGFVTAVDS